MFGFVYEDSDIEKEVIQTYLSSLSSPKGLMILSGGCTMFDIAHYFISNGGELIAVDSNIQQLNLVNQKRRLQIFPEQYNELIEKKTSMTFDRMFEQIKNDPTSLEDVFSTDNLIAQFGPDAVTNTSESFAAHFAAVYQKKGPYFEWIWNRNMDCKKWTPDLVKNRESILNVQCRFGPFADFLYPNNTNTYDFIQTSNLTDWMDAATFDVFCEKLTKSLNPNGVLVMRRLLSNNRLLPKFPGAKIMHDKTDFYSETICYINK